MAQRGVKVDKPAPVYYLIMKFAGFSALNLREGGKDMDRIRKWTWVFTGLFAIAVLGFCPPQAEAFNQPIYNLGLTNAMDGAIPGPGLYAMSYGQFYFGNNIEVNGDIPEPLSSILHDTEITSLAALWQIAYISKLKLFGAYLGWNIVIPVVVINSEGPINNFIQTIPGHPSDFTQIENTGGIGDIITGPVIQWSNKKLFGKPFFHRIELDVIVPSGKYSDNYLINPGSNIVTINPYYAFTWFPMKKIDFSMRIHYAWNSKNNDPYVPLYGPDASLKPGQNFHFNYTLQYNPYKSLWGGVAGYAMWQLTEDTLTNSVLAGSPLENALVQKERVFGVGPIFSLTPLKNLLISWASAWEVGAENRAQGFRTTFKVLYGF